MKSILFLVVCAGCLLEKSVGFNYYIQTGAGNPGLLSYPLIAPLSAIWDCDKKKGGGESSSSEGEKSSGESGEKSEGSKEESKEEGGESKEESKSKESGSSEEGEKKEEGSEESGEKKEGSEESGEKKEGSEESGEKKEDSEESGEKKEGSEESGEKKEEGSEESGEKKKGGEKKKKKYVFPPRAYDFPSSKVQQIVYSPLSTYSYGPYRSYVVQQPAAPYPVKRYQYVSVPSSSIFNGYSAPVVSRLVNSPVTKIVYSPGLNYQQVPNYSGGRFYPWNGGISYYKK